MGNKKTAHTVFNSTRCFFCYRLVQVVLQLAAAAWMAQLAQSFGLDLADALAGDVELLAHLFQRAAAPIVQAEAQLQHFALALGQAIQHILNLLFEQLMARGFRRGQSCVVLDEVAEMTVFFLANRRLQADRLLANLDNLTHFLRADLHLLGNLLRCRLAPQVLQQTTADADQTVNRLHHMHGDTNRARLVSDSARNGLANPPRRIRAELVALRVVELLDRANQANIALLDQVQQAHTTTDILLRNTDDETQVGFGQAALRLLTILDYAPVRIRLQQLRFTALHTLRQLHLFLRCQQRNTTNLAQIHTHGIVQAALQVRNYNAKAIVQLIFPFLVGHRLNVHLDLHVDDVFRARLPVCRWLLAWIQCVHRLFVL